MNKKNIAIKINQLLTKNQIADYLNITIKKINELIEYKEIPYFKIGKNTIRFDLGEVKNSLINDGVNDFDYNKMLMEMGSSWLQPFSNFNINIWKDKLENL